MQYRNMSRGVTPLKEYPEFNSGNPKLNSGRRSHSGMNTIKQHHYVLTSNLWTTRTKSIKFQEEWFCQEYLGVFKNDIGIVCIANVNKSKRTGELRIELHAWRVKLVITYRKDSYRRYLRSLLQICTLCSYLALLSMIVFENSTPALFPFLPHMSCNIELGAIYL